MGRIFATEPQLHSLPKIGLFQVWTLTVWQIHRGPSQAAQVKRWQGILRGVSDAALEDWILSLTLLQHSCSMPGA